MAINPLVCIKQGTHTASKDLTGAQLLAAAEMHIGHKIRIQSGCEVDTIRVTDNELLVKYTRYTQTVATRETRRTGAHTVLMVWNLVADAWLAAEPYEAAQPDFTPYVIHESGAPVRDEAEQATRRDYEAACHRPGTGSQPMDNADRTAEGYTPESMRRHWA